MTALPSPVKKQMDRPVWLAYMERKLRPRRKRRKRTVRMAQTFDKSDPLMAQLKDYKRANKMKTLGSFEDLVETVEGQPAVASVKVDGAINMLGWDGREARLVSIEGRIRRSLPLTDEVERVLRGKGPSAFVVELFGVDLRGEELPYPRAISLLRSPKTEADEKRIRVAVFDVLVYDGRDVSRQDYWKRLTIATNLFGNGTYISPVYATEDGKSTVEKLWEQKVLGEGHEGLVVRVDGAYKIKPINTLDLAVVGVQPVKSHPDRAGALLLAFMDEEGAFRDAGKVGTGLTHRDREEWLQWAKKYKVAEEDGRILVDPFAGDSVVEVRFEGLNVGDRPASRYSAGRYEPVGQRTSSALRKPVVVRIRDDKHVSPGDVRIGQIPQGLLRKAQEEEGEEIVWTGEEFEAAEPGVGFEAERPVPIVEPEQEWIEIDWATLHEYIISDIQIAQLEVEDGRAILHVPIDSPLLKHVDDLESISLGPASGPGGYAGALFVIHPDQTMADYAGYPYSAKGIAAPLFNKELEKYQGELVVQYQPTPVEPVEEEEEEEETVLVKFKPREREEEEVVPLGLGEIEIEIDPEEYAREWGEIDEYLNSIEEMEAEAEEWEPRFPVIVRISPHSAIGLTEAYATLQYSSTGPIGKLVQDWGADEAGNNNVAAFIDDTLAEGWEVDYRPDERSPEEWVDFVSSVAGEQARGTPAVERQKWLERLQPEVEEEREETKEELEEVPAEELGLADRARKFLGAPPDVDVAVPEGKKREDMPEQYYVAHWIFIDVNNETQPSPWRFDTVAAPDVLKLYDADEDMRKHMDAVMVALGMEPGRDYLERVLAPSLEEEIPEGEDSEKYIEDKLEGKLGLLMTDLNRARADAGEITVLLNPNFMKIPRYVDSLGLLKTNVEQRSPGVTVSYEDSTDVDFYEGYRIEAEDWQVAPEEEVEAPLTQDVVAIYGDLKRQIDELAPIVSSVYVYVNPSFLSEHPEVLTKLEAEVEPFIHWDTDENVPYEQGASVSAGVSKEEPEEAPPEEVPEAVPGVPEEVPPEEALTYEEIVSQHPEYIDRYRNAYFDLFMRGEIEEAKFDERDIADAYSRGIGTQESEEEAAASLEGYIKEILQAREKVREEEARKFPYEDVLRFLREDAESRRPVIVYVSEGDYPEVYTGGDYKDQFAGLKQLDQIALTINPDLGPGDWSYDLVDLVEKLPPEWKLERERKEKYGPIQEKRIRTILEKNRANWENLESSMEAAFEEASGVAAKLPDEERNAYLSSATDGINWLNSVIRYDSETKQPVDLKKLMQPQRANDLQKFIDSKQEEIASIWYDEVQQQDSAMAEGYRLLAKAYGIDLPRTRYPEGEGPSLQEQESIGGGEAKAFLRERPSRSEFWDRYYYVHRAYDDPYKIGWLDAAYRTGYIPLELTDPNVIGGPRAPEEEEEIPPEELEPAPTPPTEEEFLEVYNTMVRGLVELVSTYTIADDVRQLRVRLNPIFLEDSDSRSFFLGQLDDMQTTIGYAVNLSADERVARSPGFEIVKPRTVEEVPEAVPEEAPKVPEEVPEAPSAAPEAPPIPGVPPPPKRRPYSEESYERDGRALGENVFKQYIKTVDKERAAEDLWRRWHAAAVYADGEPGRGANLWWTGYLRGFESAFTQQDPRWQGFFDDAREKYPALNQYWTKAPLKGVPKPKPRPRTRREVTPEGRGVEVGKYLFNKYMTGPTPPSSILVDDMFRRRLNQVPVDQRDVWTKGVVSIVDPEGTLGWAAGFQEVADAVRRKDRLDEIRARVPETMEEAGGIHAEDVMSQGMGATQVLDQLSKPDFQKRPMDFKQGFWDFFQTHDDPEYRRLGQFLYENLPKESGIPASDEAEGRMVAEALQGKLAGDPEVRPKLLAAYRDYCSKHNAEWVAGFWGSLPEALRTYVEGEYADHPEWTYPGPKEAKPYMRKPKGRGWTPRDYTDYGSDLYDYAQHMGWSAQEAAKYIAVNTQHFHPTGLAALFRGLPEVVRQYLPSETEMLARGIGEAFRKKLLGGKTVTADEPITQYQPGGLEYMVPYMRGDELAVQYFGRGSERPSEPIFPFDVGDSGTLQELGIPIVSEYLSDLAQERFGVADFLDIVNRQDPKIIRFVYSESAPKSIWEGENTLAINLFRVHNIDDLMIVLIHEFSHVMTILARGPVSEREERADATSDEYVEFPEEETAYQEMIRFMSFILRMPRDAIREKLLDIVGEGNADVVDRWIRVTLGVKLPETEEEFFQELLLVRADFPEHPDTIIVKKNEYYPAGLTEADIWNYYDSVKVDIVAELKGHDVMAVLRVDGEVYRRREDGFIRIDSVKDFDKYNSGRVVEFHRVVGDTTPYGYVDIDPKESVPFEKTKRTAADVLDVLEALSDVESVDLVFSGGSGFHLYPRYGSVQLTDRVRKELRSSMDEYIEQTGDEKLTTGVTREKDMVRLDTSTLHRMGSLRVPGSLNAETGLRCVSLSRGALLRFKKESAKIKT